MNRRTFLQAVVAVVVSRSLPTPTTVSEASIHTARCNRWAHKCEYHRGRVEKILKNLNPKWGTVHQDRVQFTILVAFYKDDYDDGGGGRHVVSVCFDVFELEQQQIDRGYNGLILCRVADAMQDLEDLKKERRYEKTC